MEGMGEPGEPRGPREPREPRGHRGPREAREQMEPLWKKDGLTEEEKLMALLHGCSHLIAHRGEGKGGQRRVLSILAEREQVTQRDLMELLDIRAGSASEILGKMEADGKIRRSRNEFDRRSVNVELTEEGRNALEQMGDKRGGRLSHLFEGMTQEEKVTLSGLLEKLLTNWERQDTEERECRKECNPRMDRRNHGPKECQGRGSHEPHVGRHEQGEHQNHGFREGRDLDGEHNLHEEHRTKKGPKFHDEKFHGGRGAHKSKGFRGFHGSR